MLRERKLILLLLAFSLAIFVIYQNKFSGNEKQWKPIGLKWIINRDTSSVKQDGTSVEVRSNVSVQTANCIWTNTTTVLRPCFFRTGKEFENTQRPRLHLATVACGGRWQEGLVLLKSVVALTTRSLVVFHVFTETAQMPHFKKALQDWPEAVLERIEYRLYLATYPPEFKKWKGKFGNCASQRLLFPSLLRDVDAVVYVDADAVLLSPLDK
ncbi:glucoside xylosyltransferase 2-like, partial [Littorina saxatilis]|uniref:glucoside xylosyltransferase 2-like n=1 Tax=Littorina saxatilis TaxID=31220 RepID=UPI0038B649D1